MYSSSTINAIIDLVAKSDTANASIQSFKDALKFHFNNGVSANSSVAGFNGTLNLSDGIGTIWNDVNQSGALTITVGSSAREGGTDSVRIVADGNTITLDAAFTWVKMSSDSIGTTAADVNELIFVCKKLTYSASGNINGGTILYAVKLNP